MTLSKLCFLSFPIRVIFTSVFCHAIKLNYTFNIFKHLKVVVGKFKMPFLNLLSYCIHTSITGWRCAFWGLWPLTWFLTFDFEAIIDFNWLRMISSVSGRYLTKRLLDCFHTAHTPPSVGVDVPFGNYDLWPNFSPLILKRLLTLIDCGL